MGQKEVLYKKNKETYKFSTEDFQLHILGELIRSHSIAHYPDQRISYSIKIATIYSELIGKSKDHLETALKKFDGFDDETFTKNFKSEILNQYTHQLDKSIEELIKYSQKKLAPKKPDAEVKKEELEKIAFEPLKEIGDTLPFKKDVLKFRLLKATNIKNLKAYLNKVSKLSAKLVAVSHVEKHININNKYTFKHLVDSINEIYSRLINQNFRSVNEKNDEIIADWVNEAVSNYEVIGNIEYLLNEEHYYQAVFNNFKNKSKFNK